MLFFLLAVAFICGAYGVAFPRVRLIAGIDAVDLFQPPSNWNDPTSPWRGPALNPTPDNHRAIYFPFWNQLATGSVSTVLSSLPVTFIRPLTAIEGQGWQAKLEAPYLERDPNSCADTIASNDGYCRCNVGPADTPAPIYFVNGSIINQIAAVVDTDTIEFRIPNWVYFPHAPFAGQNPYLRTWRRLCLKEPSGGYPSYIDTNVWIAVVSGCSETFPCGSVQQFNQLGKSAPSGISYTSVLPDPQLGSWECNTADGLGAFYDFTSQPQLVTTGLVEREYCWGETLDMYEARKLQDACCGFNSTTLGICFDSEVQQCCGHKPFNPVNETCCSRTSARIAHITDSCPCSNATVVDDCQKMGPNVITATDGRGSANPLSTDQACCTLTKYPELLEMNRPGKCYSPADPLQQCCDDGTIYNPGTSQCCPVNGVQSLNISCPCNIDSHCPTSTACCLQQSPPSWGAGEGLDALATSGVQQCSPYANWPSGQGTAASQFCFGNCYRTEYEVCCNGQACVSAYTTCCNNTCCNTESSVCKKGTQGPGNRVDPNGYGVLFDVCTAQEYLTVRRSFYIIAMPVFWFVSTGLLYGIALYTVLRAAVPRLDHVEKAILVIASGIVLLSIATFFSPAYKYGLVAIMVSIVAMIGTIIKHPAMSYSTCILCLFLALYWTDPFAGNIWLSLPGGAATVGMEEQFGVAHGIHEFLSALANNQVHCIDFYDFFTYDPSAHDFDRLWNPKQMAWGYCSLEWLSALFVITLVILMAVFLLLLLVIFSLAKQLIGRSPVG